MRERELEVSMKEANQKKEQPFWVDYPEPAIQIIPSVLDSFALPLKWAAYWIIAIGILMPGLMIAMIHPFLALAYLVMIAGILALSYFQRRRRLLLRSRIQEIRSLFLKGGYLDGDDHS